MEKFFEYFQIPKIEYREPGRCVDDHGELCEWYISYDYQSTEPVFFDLLNYYNMQLHGTPLMIDNMTEYKLCKLLKEAILQRVQELEKEMDVTEEKRDIYDIFEDYYCFSRRKELGL